jgi:hypothetical protein
MRVALLALFRSRIGVPCLFRRATAAGGKERDELLQLLEKVLGVVPATLRWILIVNLVTVRVLVTLEVMLGDVRDRELHRAVPLASRRTHRTQPRQFSLGHIARDMILLVM